MQLKKFERAMGLTLLLVGSFGVVACGDDPVDPPVGADATTNKDALPGQDVSTTGDSGPDGPDSGRDAGTGDVGPRPDSGRDGGPGPGNCMQGTEGCPCDPAMMCGGGLTCVTWPQASMTDPIISTCVQTCMDDMSCAGNALGNNICRAFFTDTGVEGICAKSEAAAGQSCRGSRRPGTRDIVGCTEDLLCLNNLVGGDEGVCAQICQVSTATPTGGCSGATPYCQPSGSGLVTGMAPNQVPLGVCAVGRITQGQRCDQVDPTRSCDTSTLTIVQGNGHACIGFPDLPDDQGVCIEICARNGGTCGNVEPGGLGRAVCTPYVPEADDPNAALCVDECDDFPENCGGPGNMNQGRMCENTWVFDQNFPLSFCVDRGTPPLMEATVVDNGGQPMISMAEDCRPGIGSEGDAYRCPEGSFCITLAMGQPGQGACVRGCTTATSAPATGCTATSSVCLTAGDPADPTGICAQ